MLLTYYIMQKVPSTEIQYVEQHTASDWFQFCREVLLDFVERNCEMIGEEGKVVEIDESKFGKTKYHRGHYVNGQWVFGGVERGAGITFHVAVHDICRNSYRPN
jgi:hypothetical protein